MEIERIKEKNSLHTFKDSIVCAKMPYQHIIYKTIQIECLQRA